MMLMGKSPMHVNQTLGSNFSNTKVKGYYNNLTQKVDIEPKWLKSEDIINVLQENGEYVIFPVAVFQYALGCYDLFIETGLKKYKFTFLKYANWTFDNQDEKGRWDNFSFVYPEAPYGAMAQGEGVSVLVRAYLLTEDVRYLESAKKSLDFMLRDVKDGGTTSYENKRVIFLEYTNQSVVMNGWIFAWWGLFDYVLLTNDNGKYKQILDKSLDSLVEMLPNFRNAYWSLYDLDGKLASPFYHNLHIAQMEAMFQLTSNVVFDEYAKRWRKQQHTFLNKFFAFIVKAIQKIRE